MVAPPSEATFPPHVAVVDVTLVGVAVVRVGIAAGVANVISFP